MSGYEMGVAEMAAMAAAGADGQAFYELGCMYAAGRAVPTDLVAAHKWFNVSAARGCREGALRRSELAGEMTAAEIAAAQREARLFLACH